MPNEDGTPTTDERLAAVDTKQADILTALNALHAQRGILASVVAEPFACRCPQMFVAIGCEPHDFKVTYPNWTANS